MADDTETKAKTGPGMGLSQFCTKFAKRANADRKRRQHLANLAARAVNKGRRK